MSREEIVQQHESVKNIERLSANINLKQGIVIITIIGSIVAWWFLGKAKDQDSNTELKIEIIKLNQSMLNQAKNDSIHNIIINNKIDNSIKQQDAHFQQQDAHFLLIEEKMKHFKQLGVNNINSRGGIIGVTERKDQLGNILFSGIK